MSELKSIKTQIHFASDNNSGVLPEIIEDLQAINQKHVASYGADPYTDLANKEVVRLFGDCDVFYVFNGTAANVLAIKAMVKSYEAIICSDISHLQNDECGAPEAHIGSKLLLCKSVDGKLDVASIKEHLVRRGDTHHVQPKMISITQPTEYGTCYSLKELKAISNLAKKEGLYLHMDGSRLVNASITLQKTLKEITNDLGFDLVSFGGTKNGLLGGEAILSFNKELIEPLRYIRKQSMQLAGKMRFVSVQFYSWLYQDRWKKHAQHVVELASYLKARLSDIPEVTITQLVESNAVFVKIPKEAGKALRKEYFFYIWNETTWEARLMVSFDTTKEDIDLFCKALQKYLK